MHAFPHNPAINNRLRQVNSGSKGQKLPVGSTSKHQINQPELGFWASMVKQTRQFFSLE